MAAIITNVKLTTVMFISLYGVLGEDIYGGTLYWRPTGRVTSQLAFSYTLTWSTTGLPGCGFSQKCIDSQINNHPKKAPLNRLSGLSWFCLDCLPGGSQVQLDDLSSMRFIDIGNLTSDYSYEMGEGTFNYNFTRMSRYRIALANSTGYQLLQTEIDLSYRNDTKRPNVGPTSAHFPVYIVPDGCSTQFKLHTWDGDGDLVRCRWAANEPRYGTLDEKNCLLDFDSKRLTKQALYTMDFYLEDYSNEPVLFQQSSRISYGPFSKTTIRISVHVTTALRSPSSCIPPTKLTNLLPLKDRPPAGFDLVVPYNNVSGLNNVELPFAVKTHGGYRFVESLPRGLPMVDSSLGAPGFIYRNGNWTVSNQQEGIHMVCDMAYTRQWVSIGSACVAMLIGDNNNCIPNPCPAAEICSTVWQAYKCIKSPTATTQAPCTTALPPTSKSTRLTTRMSTAPSTSTTTNTTTRSSTSTTTSPSTSTTTRSTSTATTAPSTSKTTHSTSTTTTALSASTTTRPTSTSSTARSTSISRTSSTLSTTSRKVTTHGASTHKTSAIPVPSRRTNKSSSTSKSPSPHQRATTLQSDLRRCNVCFTDCCSNISSGGLHGPSLAGGTHLNGDGCDNLPLRVGVPVACSLLLIILITAAAVYIKMKLQQKSKSVEPVKTSLDNIQSF